MGNWKRANCGAMNVRSVGGCPMSVQHDAGLASFIEYDKKMRSFFRLSSLSSSVGIVESVAMSALRACLEVDGSTICCNVEYCSLDEYPRALQFRSAGLGPYADVRFFLPSLYFCRFTRKF